MIFKIKLVLNRDKVKGKRDKVAFSHGLLLIFLSILVSIFKSI